MGSEMCIRDSPASQQVREVVQVLLGHVLPKLPEKHFRFLVVRLPGSPIFLVPLGQQLASRRHACLHLAERSTADVVIVIVVVVVVVVIVVFVLVSSDAETRRRCLGCVGFATVAREDGVVGQIVATVQLLLDPVGQTPKK